MNFRIERLHCRGGAGEGGWHKSTRRPRADRTTNGEDKAKTTDEDNDNNGENDDDDDVKRVLLYKRYALANNNMEHCWQ